MGTAVEDTVLELLLALLSSKDGGQGYRSD